MATMPIHAREEKINDIQYVIKRDSPLAFSYSNSLLHACYV